jgi:hypothetical protein
MGKRRMKMNSARINRYRAYGEKREDALDTSHLYRMDTE